MKPSAEIWKHGFFELGMTGDHFSLALNLILIIE
jgi:hypothetical protein